MAYRKVSAKNTRDQRPKFLQDGNLNKAVGKNLSDLQEGADWTDAQMAELLGMTVANYGRIKRGDQGINAEKLSILYYSLGVNLNRLVASDNSYNLKREDDDPALREEFDFDDGLSKIIADIQATDNYYERVRKILKTYNDFGVMLTGLMKPENRPDQTDDE